MFDVLDPTLDIGRSLWIEASAGTGKTFALEHLTIRWLLCQEEISLDQIALISFTRKSAQDLSLRLRARLEKTYEELCAPSCSTPYLQMLSEEKRAVALLRSIESLINFDLLNVRTIHSFAAKLMQRSGWQADSSQGFQKEYVKELVERHLENLHLRSKKKEVGAGSGALKILDLVENRYRWNLDLLKDDLVEILRLPFFSSDTSSTNSAKKSTSLEIWLSFFEKESLLFASFEELERLSVCFKELHNKNGQLKISAARVFKEWQEILSKRKNPSFAISLESFSESWLAFLEMFQPEKLKKKATEAAQQFAMAIARTAPGYSWLQEGSLKKRGLALLAKSLQKSLAPLFKKERRLGHDVVLQQLKQTLESPLGPSLARSLKLLVVDEFQDTDPMQWSLFQKLAELNPSLQMILVGDPKQSIYGFRQADIYTYMQAKIYLQKERKGAAEELRTNYRSDPSLLQALNWLFSSPGAGKWLKLPRTKSFLECPEVGAGREALGGNLPRLFFHDLDSHSTETIEEAAAIWIDYEVRRLRSLGWTRFAILVGSNQQSREMQQLLEKKGQRCCLQKPLPLAKLQAFTLFQIIVEAFHAPFEKNAIQHLLSHPLWGFSEIELPRILGGELFERMAQEVRSPDALYLEEGSAEALLWKEMTALHLTLKERGLGAFWGLFWQLSYRSENFYQRLKKRETGREIYSQLQAIFLWLEQETPHIFGLETLKKLEALASGLFEESALYYPEKDPQALSLVTVHSSKGLEYEVVFCLSNLSAPHKRVPKWMPVEQTTGQSLLFDIEKEDPLYLHALQESDAERARTLYVAWTRAREYLLVGYRSRPPKKGTGATALELLQASWENPEAATLEKLYQGRLSDPWGHESLWSKTLKKLQEQKKAALTDASSLEREKTSSPFLLEKGLCRSFSLPKEPHLELFQAQIWRKSSFSALVSSGPSPSRSPKKPLPSPLPSIPSGPEIGRLWHLMLQRAIQWQQNGHSLKEISAYLCSELFLQERPRFAHYRPWLSSMSDQVMELLTCSWRLPLLSKSSLFSLKEAAAGTIWTEKSFAISPEIVAQKIGRIKNIGEGPLQLHGVIDALVWTKEGVFFIDWKSHPLTKGEEERMALESAKSSRYDLQALIYQSAIEANFASSPVSFLGGLYIYIRGPVALYWSPLEPFFLCEKFFASSKEGKESCQLL